MPRVRRRTRGRARRCRRVGDPAAGEVVGAEREPQPEVDDVRRRGPRPRRAHGARQLGPATRPLAEQRGRLVGGGRAESGEHDTQRRGPGRRLGAGLVAREAARPRRRTPATSNPPACASSSMPAASPWASRTAMNSWSASSSRPARAISRRRTLSVGARSPLYIRSCCSAAQACWRIERTWTSTGRSRRPPERLAVLVAEPDQEVQALVARYVEQRVGALVGHLLHDVQPLHQPGDGRHVGAQRHQHARTDEVGQLARPGRRT